MKTKYNEEIQQALMTVVKNCEMEDRSVRERQIRMWRRLKLFWEGFQRVWYSEVAHDWRIWEETKEQGTDQAYYDKTINIFRAYLESIIAALSVTVPPLSCFPDDADDTLDLATARAGDKICQLIYRHNDVSLLWLHALFIFCTEGMVGCYAYPKESKEYGTYQDKEYDETEEEHELTMCSNCGYPIDDRIISPDETLQGSPESVVNKLSPEQLVNQEEDEFQPDNEDANLHAALNQGQDLCPSCMTMMEPELRREKFIVTRLVGITNLPKSRVCMEAYGGLYIQIPNYAKIQCDCPYLIFSQEKHYAMVIEEFGLDEGHKKNIIKHVEGGNTGGSYDQYDQWGRMNPQYQGEYPINTVTVKKAWLRPGSYHILNDEDMIKTLKKKFPDGARVTVVNNTYVDACNESLDDCWTLSIDPMSDFIHHNPLGTLLTAVQEITNDLLSLTLQTIEHGVPLTFADPAVLNFKAFETTEVTPGGVFPATPKSGKSLNDAFHETKMTALSGEVLPFSQNIQSMGQIVSGALPSLFGGNIQGSETASQYSMSRSQALQRLQNTWKIFTVWWKTTFSKVIPMYINLVKEDERDVQKDKDGNFINVFIRKAELEGKIGKIELEANENLPMTWMQRKDVIEKMMQNANPEIMKIIAAPENISLLHEALGLDEFYVPGEDDKDKQYDEIKLLLNSEPIVDPMSGEEIPSVEIDPIFDNHAIEFEICRKWIISEAGRQAKTDNPVGYKNVLLHGKLHFDIMNQQQMMNQAPPENGAAPEEKPNPLMNEAPIMGDSNVETIQ